jgi:carbonic anhydrase/acetyltransferase-like protein (isoleucine patch superfamily)
MDHALTSVGDYVVYIGTNAVILKGCTIGDHLMIAAGAVVLANTILSPHCLVESVLAIIKKNISDELRKKAASKDTVQ